MRQIGIPFLVGLLALSCPGCDELLYPLDAASATPDAVPLPDEFEPDSGLHRADAALLDGTTSSAETDAETGEDGGLVASGDQAGCHEGMSKQGASALCASCACGRCPSEASACATDARCVKLATCIANNRCAGMACYCGLDFLGCALGPLGPCQREIEAATGAKSEDEIQGALNDAKSTFAHADALARCTSGESPRCEVACAQPEQGCGFNDLSCQQRYCKADPSREARRLASAKQIATPRIARIRVNEGQPSDVPSAAPITIAPGDTVVMEGSGFGAGPDVDFAKLLIGNVRALESDLIMYEQQLDIVSQVHSETPEVRSQWPKDIVSWSDTRIEFRVPGHVTRGPIFLQVQKRLGANRSYVQPGEAHQVIDAQTIRIADPSFTHRCDVVSELSAARASNEVAVRVENQGLEALLKKGREIFWSYDYNIGLTHGIRGLDWTAIMAGKATDPVTGKPADPATLFGAVPTRAGEVPSEALNDVFFDPYPQKNPIPGLLLVLSDQSTSGMTRDSGYVGYRYAESINPYMGEGQWIGFNCASCHGYRVSFESAPGVITNKVIPGLPNPRWSMKWAVLGDFKGVVGEEPGPDWDPTVKPVNKTALIYAMPHGHGEHDLVRFHGEGSLTDNDYGFSPIAIPNVTNYLPIRRSLSHTESYVGFEGSYIHAEEPDGALGSMDAASLKALTAYMGTLDVDDAKLRDVGVYRHLRAKGRDSMYGGDSEGMFVQKGARAYPAVAAGLDRGAAIFESRCKSCHEDQVGLFTSERMLPLHEVGRFFEPTVYHREMQALRVSFLRDLYWVQHRGLLSDGHVRNLEELVDPERCREGSLLYDRYYTMHAVTPLPSAGPDFPTLISGENARGTAFRVPRASSDSEQARAQNTFVERFRYFSKLSSDPEHYYWDYQKLRREYGPWELGSARPIGMPAAPHPWCARTASEVDDLVLYLSSL